MTNDELQQNLENAAKLISNADSILICAGAGMSVDSGIPSFRGKDGFWNIYPALAKGEQDFYQSANPKHFAENPEQAWGFYGHRLILYRNAIPHEGYQVLKKLVEGRRGGHFVFTSNVDGQFQKAGFSEFRIAECHGSIHHMQCMRNCSLRLWSANSFEPEIDKERGLLVNELPRCPACLGLARPNILMFDDWNWISSRSSRQIEGFNNWFENHFTKGKNPIVIEIGAGTGLPKIRKLSNQVPYPLIRINLHEAEVPSVGRPHSIGIQMGGLEALTAISKLMNG